jgi:hypothetical protein
MDLVAQQVEDTPEGRTDTMKKTVRHEPFDTETRRHGESTKNRLTQRSGEGETRMKEYARWYSEMKTLVFFPRVSVSPSHRVLVSHRPER